jgi:hypothetical protein
MTDDEIRQSRIDHAHAWDAIVMVVYSNTPSRIGRALRGRKNTLMFYDYAAERHVEVPRETR